jgi:hypothetical protein
MLKSQERNEINFPTFYDERDNEGRTKVRLNLHNSI